MMLKSICWLLCVVSATIYLAQDKETIAAIYIAACFIITSGITND